MHLMCFAIFYFICFVKLDCNFYNVGLVGVDVVCVVGLYVLGIIYCGGV